MMSISGNYWPIKLNLWSKKKKRKWQEKRGVSLGLVEKGIRGLDYLAKTLLLASVMVIKHGLDKSFIVISASCGSTYL